MRSHDRRPGEPQMGIAPVPDVGIFAQVFVADVVSADPRLPTVDDDHFAVVAEIELEFVAPALAAAEGTDPYAGFAQGMEIGSVE